MRRHTIGTQGRDASQLVVERGSHTRLPLSDRTNLIQLLEQWERDGKIKMTPGFRHRILSEYGDRTEEIGAELTYSLTELVEPAKAIEFLPALPRHCTEPRLGRVTEILKGIVGESEDEYLATNTVLFPFENTDVIVLMRRESSLFLDAKANDRGDWPVGTLIVTFDLD